MGRIPIENPIKSNIIGKTIIATESTESLKCIIPMIHPSILFDQIQRSSLAKLTFVAYEIPQLN